VQVAIVLVVAMSVMTLSADPSLSRAAMLSQVL
jgi:hypothetical protein